MNIIREIGAVAAIAIKELAQVAFCTACVAVPLALFYTGIIRGPLW